MVENHLHHFQKRAADGSWTFEASPMRGDIEREVDAIIAAVKAYLEE